MAGVRAVATVIRAPRALSSGVGEFLMEAGELVRGDEVVITGPTTGALIVRADDIRVGGKSVEKAVKGDAFSIAVPAKIRPADRLYRWLPTEQ